MLSFACRTRTVALMVVYFHARRSGLTSPGKFKAPPWVSPLVSSPHATELCVGRGPLHYQAFGKLVQELAKEPLENSSSFIYGPWPHP